MAKKKPPVLVPVDLMRGEESNHPDINTRSQYLAKIDGQYFAGQFSKVWFGWNFDGWHDVGLQLDKPGTNSSEWQALWEIK